MSADDKLKILIADKLHDFTDRTRMSSIQDKNKIVKYIETTLLDIIRKYYSNIQEQDFNENTIFKAYYPKTAQDKEATGHIEIKSEQELYELNPADIIFTRKNSDNGVMIAMEKYLFQYVPIWLYTLYKNKPFMTDVTVLTESDICNNLLNSSYTPPFLLKSIATIYDRNVRNIINEPCSKEYEKTGNEEIILFTKKEGELTGFDSISIKNNYELIWKLNEDTNGEEINSTIYIDKIIKSKKNSRNPDKDSNPMSLPMFFKMINELLNNTQGGKRNALESLNAQISSLYGLDINQLTNDNTYDLYIMCLTDLKSLGDLLQVKMAQISNSIFVSNDRTTCLMSAVGYNNPTLRTSKTRVNGISMRYLYLIDNDFKYDKETEKKLKEVQDKRKREEEILTEKKKQFIIVLKEFIRPQISIIENVIESCVNKIDILNTDIKKTESATLQTIETVKTGRQRNAITFNYDTYKLKLEKILLQYHLGFIYLLLQILNLPIDKILQDRSLVNIYIDGSVEKQENYIQENINLLDNLLKDIPLMQEEARVSRDFIIYKLKMFNYPHLDIIKLYNELSKMKQLSDKRYTLTVTDADIITYTVGFYNSQQELNRFIEDISYLEEKAERFLKDQQNRLEKFPETKNYVTENTAKRRRIQTGGKTATKKTIFKKPTGVTKRNTSKFTKTLTKIRTKYPSLGSSNDLIEVVLHFLVNKYKEVKKSSETESNIIKVLIFQILFYVDLYDISIPIFDIRITKNKTTTRRTTKRTTKRTQQTIKATQKNKLTTIYEGPEEGGGSISKKQFQFSQHLISQFLDRLKL